MQPLDTVPEGENVRIIRIFGGMGFSQRLLEWGLVPGAVVQVVFNRYGPVIIKVNDVTVAIGRGMANRILVERLMKHG